MTTAQTLLAFVAAAGLLTITPGLDTALVLRSATAGGARPAAYAAIGITLGCLAWGTVASVGLGTLLAASQVAYAVAKWTGAAYLCWLGLKLIAQPRTQFSIDTSSAVQLNGRQSFRQGFLTNLLNPKIGVFYVTFLPQFVPTGENVATFSFLLALIHVVLGILWFTVLISATVPLGRVLRRPNIVRLMDRIAGGVFVLFGAKLAFSRS